MDEELHEVRRQEWERLEQECAARRRQEKKEEEEDKHKCVSLPWLAFWLHACNPGDLCCPIRLVATLPTTTN